MHKPTPIACTNWLQQSLKGLIGLITLCCCAGCPDKCSTNTSTKEAPMYAPPLKPGQTLDLKTDYGKYWPGQPALFKLSETWGFAIPPQYMRFWIQRDRVTRHPAPWHKIPLVEMIGFQFFMPDFGGYTPDNYTDDFHKDRVEVIDFRIVGMGAEQPDAPGAYPPNMFARASAKPHQSIDLEQYQEIYGLRCYDTRPKIDLINDQYCYGLRDAKTNEFILLNTTPPLQWAHRPSTDASHLFHPTLRWYRNHLARTDETFSSLARNRSTNLAIY